MSSGDIYRLVGAFIILVAATVVAGVIGEVRDNVSAARRRRREGGVS